MATSPVKINPLDRKPRTAIGVGLNFSNRGVFTPTFDTPTAFKQNLINLLLSNPNERPFSDVGLGLLDFLFQPLTNETTEALEDFIKTRTSEYIPQLSIQNINIQPDTDKNTLTVSIKYEIVDTGIKDELTVEAGI